MELKCKYDTQCTVIAYIFNHYGLVFNSAIAYVTEDGRKRVEYSYVGGLPYVFVLLYLIIVYVIIYIYGHR